MAGSETALFRPIQLGALALPHRIAMAPMTRFRADQGGCVGELGAAYYSQRASAAMIVSETSYVHPSGRISDSMAGLHDEAQVASWRGVTEAVHARGGRIVAQLMHGGRFSHPALQPDGGPPLAPSAVAIDPPERIRMVDGLLETVTPRAITAAEIAELVEAYGRAAGNAVRAGFDAVELHGGNGYLPSQFLSTRSNRRTDAYGGASAGRCRFLLEAVEAIVGVVGYERLGVKVSPFIAMHDGLDGAATEETHRHLLGELDGRGLAYVHAQLQFDYLPILPEPFDPLGLIRGAFSGPLVASGGFDRASAAQAVGEGRCDVAAFGRRFAANPDLPERIRDGLPENPLDVATLVAMGPDPRGYTDYPRAAA